MVNLTKGETLYLPVEVGSGPFVGELLVSFPTLEGPVSGFISEDQIINRGNLNLIEAEVLDVDSDRISVRIQGSFFTTTGLAHISREASFERAA